MDARCRRIHAPQDDELRVGIVLIRDRGHFAVEGEVRGPGWRGAHRPRQARGAEAAPELRIEVVLGEETIRAAVRVGKNRFAARVALRASKAIDDELERLVPGNAFELPRAFWPSPDGGVEQAVWAVHALAELAHLRTDVAAGHRVLVGAVNLEHSAVPDRHRQAARV